MGTLRTLNLFLHGKKFRQQIVSKYQRFEILAEGGLRTAVANLLDAKLRTMSGTAKTYRVSCEQRLGNVIPDILVWKDKAPRFWIELKDTRTFNKASANADWEKLRKYLPMYASIKSGFLIYVARKRSKRGLQFPIKRGRDTLRLWPIPIILQDEIGGFEEWNKEYKRREHYHKTAKAARAASA